jgi:hypothetical protein
MSMWMCLAIGLIECGTDILIEFCLHSSCALAYLYEFAAAATCPPVIGVHSREQGPAINGACEAGLTRNSIGGAAR